MGKLTISMAIFNSKLLVYQRVYIYNIHESNLFLAKIPQFHTLRTQAAKLYRGTGASSANGASGVRSVSVRPAPPRKTRDVNCGGWDMQSYAIKMFTFCLVYAFLEGK